MAALAGQARFTPTQLTQRFPPYPPASRMGAWVRMAAPWLHGKLIDFPLPSTSSAVPYRSVAPPSSEAGKKSKDPPSSPALSDSGRYLRSQSPFREPM